jgi:hypothetical protein
MDILQLDRAEMQQPPPETPETVAAALEAQELERATCIKRLLALFCDIHQLELESEATQQHFAQWGMIAVRGASLGADQFRHVALASHAAAQAGSDLCASLEQYAAVDLLQADHAKERQWWTQISSRAVQTYLRVLGGPQTQAAWGLYGDRLKLVKR